MLLLTAVGNGGAQDRESGHKQEAGEKCTGCEFRIGHLDRAVVNGPYHVSLYDTIHKNMQYHVFLANGKEWFSSKRFKEIYCEFDPGDTRLTWRLMPDTQYVPLELLKLMHSCLVVGTSVGKSFPVTRVEQVTKDLRNICFATVMETDSLITDSTTINDLQYYSAGTDGRTHRIFIEKINGFMALCEVTMKKCGILFAKASFSRVPRAVFCGQADLDGDGISDVFAIDAGDFDGEWLLLNKNGEWALELGRL
jgi:hypothetical protein